VDYAVVSKAVAQASDGHLNWFRFPKLQMT
jgi:hypothetical protein